MISSHFNFTSIPKPGSKSVCMCLGDEYDGLRFLLHSYGPTFPLKGYGPNLNTNIRNLESWIQEGIQVIFCHSHLFLAPLNFGEWRNPIFQLLVSSLSHKKQGLCVGGRPEFDSVVSWRGHWWIWNLECQSWWQYNGILSYRSKLCSWALVFLSVKFESGQNTEMMR